MKKIFEVNNGKKECVLTNVTNEDLKLLRSNPKAFWAGVTKIGDEAFEFFDDLEEIVIPEGVTVIGDGAFQSCVNLKRVVMPKSLTRIGAYAFSNCRSLKDIVIPENVKEIWDFAFKNCKSLKRIVVPEGVENIAWGLFCGCTKLIGVTMPNSATYINSEAFKWCTRLKSIIIPNSVRDINEGAFICCKNLESVVLPEGMTEIENDIFFECDKIKSVYIPLSFGGLNLKLFETDDELYLRDNKFFKDGEFIVEYEKGKFAKIKAQDVFADKWVEGHAALDRMALKEIRETMKEKVQKGELEEVADPRIEVNNAKMAIANAASCVPSTKGKTTTKKEVEEPRWNKVVTKKPERDFRDR